MSKDNHAENRVAALEAELARIQSERALMDARIRMGQLDAPAEGTRRADVLGWGAFFVAAALVASLVVTIAQKQPMVVHERTRVETVVVPDAPIARGEGTADAAPEVVPAAPVRTDRARTPRTTPPTHTDLLGDDRCGNDPTCGI